jgi:hypothetical protein
MASRRVKFIPGSRRIKFIPRRDMTSPFHRRARTRRGLMMELEIFTKFLSEPFTKIWRVVLVLIAVVFPTVGYQVAHTLNMGDPLAPKTLPWKLLVYLVTAAVAASTYKILSSDWLSFQDDLNEEDQHPDLSSQEGVSQMLQRLKKEHHGG